MDDALALQTLYALLRVPGALRIITSEIRPEYREDPSNPRALLHPNVEANDPGILKRPESMVIHDVVRIEPVKDGRYRAYSAERDWCEGPPAALLKRLQEWAS